MKVEFVNPEDMIFVFGSNLDGIHGAGAARYDHRNRGAQWGVGEGITGSCYALPTKGHGITFMDLNTIRLHVSIFVHYAVNNLKLKFQVTQVGCGLGGWTARDIAPLFSGASSNVYFDTAWREHLPQDAAFWGTF